MNRTLSPQQVRLVAAIGVLAVVVVAWWMFVAKHNNSASTAPPVAIPTHHTHAMPSTHARHATPAHHAARTHRATPVHIPRHGLPLKVAQALTHHSVVVVSLAMPGVAIDQLATRESEAGAKAAGVGFVALDVVKQREGGPLLTKVGVMDAPAVLVVRRHGFVFTKLQGFVDRDTVEQAVADARR
jgi:hypothetical protein